jgi:hypothetical protein
MRYIFIGVVLIHGLIHFMGFAKAFAYGNMTHLTKEISKPAGITWFVTAWLFIVTAVLILLKKDAWWIVGLLAALISQLLIFSVWKDAKFGTLANAIILVAAVFTWGTIRFENKYKKDVTENLLRSHSSKTDLLTEADIGHLPAPVQGYLRYAGVMNKPKVKNVRILFEGQMRDKGKAYFPFTSEQYNFFDEPTRLFFMKGKMKGITVPGYHKYARATATMDIKPFGLFSVAKKEGDMMNRAETVTLFNDMCLMAPATLVDKRIQWQAIDSTSCKAIFTNQGISITATLFFNKQGQLIDFLSNDRIAVADMKQYPFYTPISNYKKVQGINIGTYGEAIWQYPDGKFTYGKFNLKEIEYNVSGLK